MAALRSIEELQQYVNNRSIPLIPKRERIQIQIDSLNADANEKLEAEFNKLNTTCGCAEGSIASVVGMVFFVIYLTFIDVDAAFTGMEALFYAMGTFFIFMLIGKFGTIIRAHFKLKKLPARYLATDTP
ncbi:MAG: hypothetical protein IME93_03765 [Proteobacteria bacterium]|nr:hypothetical protein [Pseudomonadota bacterium]